ncbi:hypothetical protein [Bosea sp. BIWAKO-01]|uniref:hypothetical protein n=1 Tax=Bosea sp. BIWAKO-01 TaxID=506668 RepID=UPI000852E249|nr:hypothetical protein [Bosea sp. BIWAKO-01]
MRHILLLAASVLPLVTVAVDDASAQGRYGGGGFHGGGWHGGMRAGGWHGRGVGFRPGGYGYRGGGWRGGWNRPYMRAGNYWGWRRGWGYSRYGYGWGAAGLIAGTAIAASAAYPYYGYDNSYPYESPYAYSYSYPAYSTPVSGDVGGYCATPVRTCALIDPGLVGTGCSCRVSGGRARGTVIGP